MDKDVWQGKWHEYKGKIKEKWGKLTDSDLTEINGKKEVLLGKLETRYGYAKDHAQKELDAFEKTCGCTGKSSESGKAEASRKHH